MLPVAPLQAGLSPQVRAAKEEQMKELKQQQEEQLRKEKERKLAVRYHKVRPTVLQHVPVRSTTQYCIILPDTVTAMLACGLWFVVCGL